jgi:branched-chain amino acid transport system substrate-binding protein
MFKKSLMFVSLIILLSLALGACAPAAAPAVEEAAEEEAVVEEAVVEEAVEPIVLGLPAILTGSDTYIHGELIIDAVEFAMEEINAKGGVLGRPLEVSVQDDAGDPKQGVNVAHSFCGDPTVVAVLGHAYSGVTIPTIPVYAECDMPMIVHGTNPKITELGYDNLVQNTPNDFITGQAAADHADSELGVKSVAIIHNKSMWGSGVAQVFEARCKEVGIEVTSYQGVDPEDVDFTPVLTKVNSENPDAVYFAGYTEQGLLRKQMVGLGMTQKWLVAEATSSEYIDVTGEDGVGSISATAAPPLDFRPEIIDFADRFEAEYGKLPESWSSYYYDMVYAVADAITKAGSTDRVEQLKNIDVPSIIYPEGLQFDAKGRVMHPVTFIYEMTPEMVWETIYVWQGVPPYTAMSDEDYGKIIATLQ